MRKILLTAAAAVVLIGAAACRTDRGPGKLADSITSESFSGVAGQDIRPGTWMFVNAGPHKPSKPCAWTVSQPTDHGLVILLASTDHTGNALQSAYVAPGQVLNVVHCGSGAWLSYDNLPLATPSAVPSAGDKR